MAESSTASRRDFNLFSPKSFLDHEAAYSIEISALQKTKANPEAGFCTGGVFLL
jgi:hypothetical protein